MWRQRGVGRGASNQTALVVRRGCILRTYATKLPTISWRWAWAPSVNVSEPGSPPLPTSCFPTPGPLVLNNAHIEEQGLYPASQPGTRNAQTSLSPSGAACPTGLYALAPNRHQAAGRPGGWGNGQLNTLAFLLPGLFHSGVIAFYARTALFLREHESCALKCKKLHCVYSTGLEFGNGTYAHTRLYF